MKFRPIFCFLFLLTAWTQAQMFNGTVKSVNGTLPRVIVLNLSTEQETRTDELGRFSIAASEDDLILFEKTGYVKARHLVEKANFSENFSLLMEEKPEELQEVIVYTQSYDLVKMGILQKQPKRLTVAERRLYTAQSTTIDGFINAISGRTKMLKRALKHERYERNYEKLKRMFEETYFTETLKIPKDDVARFLYYAAENQKFTVVLSSGNQFQIMFALSELATEFKKF